MLNKNWLVSSAAAKQIVWEILHESEAVTELIQPREHSLELHVDDSELVDKFVNYIP